MGEIEKKFAALCKRLDKRDGGLPVVENEDLVGMITESDIVQGLV